MRIRPTIFAIFTLIIFMGTVYGFRIAGVWSVSGKVDSSGKAIQPLPEDVETIKGWMTLEQVSTAYNVSLADLLLQFNLPADTPASTAIKDLETEEFSVTNLRAWLESLANPQPQTDLTPAQTITPQVMSTSVTTPATPEAIPLPTEHAAPEKTVNAKTTFQDVLDWGVAQETIESIIGSELPATSTVIKIYITARGVEFSGIKSALQAEVDKTK